MAAVTVRNLPDEVHRALKARALLHGRSTEAEIRDILVHAINPPGRVTLGSLMASVVRDSGGLTDDDTEHFARLRDTTPAEPFRVE